MSVKIEYILESSVCVTCNSMFCDSRDCPRPTRNVVYDEIVMWNNISVADLLIFVEHSNVKNMYFTVCHDERHKWNHNPYCPIHIDNSFYMISNDDACVQYKCVLTSIS